MDSIISSDPPHTHTHATHIHATHTHTHTHTHTRTHVFIIFGVHQLWTASAVKWDEQFKYLNYVIRVQFGSLINPLLSLALHNATTTSLIFNTDYQAQHKHYEQNFYRISIPSVNFLPRLVTTDDGYFVGSCQSGYTDLCFA